MIFVTRPSRLARWQTQAVIQEIQRHFPNLGIEEKTITTKGDKIKDQPLPEIGGKGLFTEELEAELLHGRAQAAVHSLKDLPLADRVGLIVVAIPPRSDARDVIVSRFGYTLDTLPKGAIVGTSSFRRSAQLLALRPDLQPKPLRGNIDTRLRKALHGEYDAIVVAGAGLIRLGLQEYIREWLPYDQMLPAPGQGALAVQCAQYDLQTIQILQVLDDKVTRTAVAAERSFLLSLGGGCSLPIGAYASVTRLENGGFTIFLRGVVVALDGMRLIQVEGQGDDAALLGKELAREALQRGARDLLPLVSQDSISDKDKPL
ncbi:MAG: hydroxymethylbilane synthase [Anaerolineales bacterium]